MEKLTKKKNLIIITAIVLATIVIVVIASKGLNSKINSNTSGVYNLNYFSASSLPPLVCGGIATQGWYLYSASQTGPFANKTVGECGISSSPSCNFPAGYYAC
jgi:hypothetical protein